MGPTKTFVVLITIETFVTVNKVPAKKFQYTTKVISLKKNHARISIENKSNSTNNK